MLNSSCNSPKTTQEEVKDMMYDESRRNDFLDQLLNDMHAELYASGLYEDEPINVGCRMPIEKRFQLEIEQRGNGKIYINDDTSVNYKEAVLLFYLANYKENDLENNYPMYTTLSRAEAFKILENAKEHAQAVKQNPKADQGIINFKWHQVKEWERKTDIFELTKAKRIREPHYQTKVVLDYNQKDWGEAAIENILQAYFEVRDMISKEYFEESYLKIFTRNQIEPNDLDQRKLAALHILLPIHVLDIPYAKAKGVRLYRFMPPPPPPELISRQK